MSASNKQLKQEYYDSITELELKKGEWNDRLNVLNDKNRENITQRESLIKQFNSKDSARENCFWGGVIAVIAGVVVYFIWKNPTISVGAGALGVFLVILGFVFRSAANKIIPEIEQYNDVLKDYDAKKSEIMENIDNIEKEIKALNKKIEEIDLAEKYAEVNEWIKTISKGYCGLYVTGEQIKSATPLEPKGGKYRDDYLIFRDLTKVGEIYINDMVYGTLKRDKECQLELIQVDEQGTQKTEFAVQYLVHGNLKGHMTAPIPVKFDRSSKFCWIHIQVSTSFAKESFGWKVYEYMFDDFEAFLAKIGITKDEIMAKYVK